jgi:quercetin dioxygenase-like cupin family protein
MVSAEQIASTCAHQFGRNSMKGSIALAAALIVLSSAAFGQQSGPAATQHQQHGPDQALPHGFETQSLLKTGKTRDNDPIAYPRTDKPELISVIGTIQPGGRTPLHEHPVPTYVYVLEGEVELQTEGAQPHRYKAGEAYIEALNRKHQLHNKGSSPAKVLVVFVGEEGKPTTVAAK